jgi:hypothetical protein
MPRNPKSEARKQRVVSVLEMRTGPLVRKYQNRDWYCTGESSVELFVTDSKDLWFDMADKDITEFATHRAGFIIFVFGDVNSFVVIPAKDLEAHISEHDGPVSETGNFHFHLERNSFRELPHWNLQPYAQNLQLIDAATRRI